MLTGVARLLREGGARDFCPEVLAVHDPIRIVQSVLCRCPQRGRIAGVGVVDRRVGGFSVDSSCVGRFGMADGSGSVANGFIRLLVIVVVGRGVPTMNLRGVRRSHVVVFHLIVDVPYIPSVLIATSDVVVCTQVLISPLPLVQLGVVEVRGLLLWVTAQPPDVCPCAAAAMVVSPSAFIPVFSCTRSISGGAVAIGRPIAPESAARSAAGAPGIGASTAVEVATTLHCQCDELPGPPPVYVEQHCGADFCPLQHPRQMAVVDELHPTELDKTVPLSNARPVSRPRAGHILHFHRHFTCVATLHLTQVHSKVWHIAITMAAWVIIVCWPAAVGIRDSA
mmetsp:Transcript_1943/g.3817  ORF Transcript_1943/g.3817 Transcript_1943/m.3817 type:complete len:338 (+) Transcript_1943:67-1080(+)